MVPSPYNPRGRLAAQPSGGEGGLTTRRYPSAVVLAPKAAASSQERAGGGGFSCRARRRESHPPDVCATSTEAEARAGCIYSQRLWPGRGGAAVRCRLPGPLCPVPAPTQARRMGRLKDEIPLSTSIYAQKYTPWAYIFEPLLDLLPRRGRQPGARGRAARPPARPHSNPLHPPPLTKANHWVCN